MLRFSGSGGEVWFAGDPGRFSVALEDCGDGWVWRAADPACRFWLPDEPVLFSVSDVPVSVHHCGGFVEFSRCLSGMEVSASGRCRHLSLAGRAVSWRLEISSVAPDTSPLSGGGERATSSVIGRGGCELDGFELASGFLPLDGGLVARLPSGGGALFGACSLADMNGSQVQLRFDKGSVTYAY